MAEAKDVKKAILLSPGLNYASIDGIKFAQNVGIDKEIYIVAAKDDIRKAGPADMQAKKIYDVLKCRKSIKILDNGGHGTDILEAHPELIGKMIDWLKK